MFLSRTKFCLGFLENKRCFIYPLSRAMLVNSVVQIIFLWNICLFDKYFQHNAFPGSTLFLFTANQKILKLRIYSIMRHMAEWSIFPLEM